MPDGHPHRRDSTTSSRVVTYDADGLVPAIVQDAEHRAPC